MHPFRINTEDPTNNKIHSVKNIPINEFIGIWVTDKPTSKKSRCLFQPQMLKKWWETDDLGRFCNHSFDPNTIIIPYPNKLMLKACKMIKSNEEITVDYREITRFTGYLPYMDF
ncbi:SET domain-containing protein-lysine N-methyltransferase [Flavobacterium tyrosinilyticum]|uniref:SET domain-containing protein-lysine N-methyltransferase n=1 Tax=Flavobacterium tyrosinilyticum TaxID=1658740 RepID=UPI00202F7249|nr:SET domain-containing protein-lysine N-methyltransferase [Flavobacterium tyrosinilyticum]MCM0665991.1 SET domain-containing protein-lysine N-methyltransferase [Flavobacterium tyrosinilyticum]